jgi:hypothetical protein
MFDRPVVLADRIFSESYVNLTQRGKRNDYVYWLDVQSAPPMIPPYHAGSAKSILFSMLSDGDLSVHPEVILEDKERRLLALWIDLLVPFCGTYTERHHWTPEQQAEYAYYQMKRDTMAEIEWSNIERFMAWQNGDIALPPPDSFPQFNNGGVERKKEFIEAWLQRYKNGKGD